MRWLWPGAYGAFKKNVALVVRVAKPSGGQNVALVVGSTGIVGAALLDILPLEDTPGGPWKVYGISRRRLPPWFAEPPLGVFYCHFDLTDPDDVAKALKPLTDITHIFYVAWDPRPRPRPRPLFRPRDEEGHEANNAMLRNVLSAVVPNCPNLVHVCLQTSREREPFEPLSTVPIPLRHYSENLSHMDHPDLGALIDGLAGSGGAQITWSVHRPSTIFGFSPGSDRNVVASLCVYAAICRKEGAALRWPGSRVAWEGFSDASDAELVAEHGLWAALEVEEPAVRNQAFNCSNGDIFKWQQLWPMLATRFDVVGWVGYFGEDKRFKLEEAMAGKEAVWAKIVKEKNLEDTKLHEITNWSFVYALFNMEREHVDTMNKSKEYGFFGFRNTVRSFNTLIEKLKADKIVP